MGRFHEAAASTLPPDTTTHEQADAAVQLLRLGVPVEDLAEWLHVSVGVIEGLAKAQDPE